MFFVKFFINFGLKITLRRFYKKSNIRDRQEKYSILKKSKHSFDNLMNFKNITENTAYFKIYYLQSILYFTKQPEILKFLKFRMNYSYVFHILKIKYFLQL